MYDSSDSESIDDDDLEGNFSSDEEKASPPASPKLKGFSRFFTKKDSKKPTKKITKYRKADTNVISVDFKKIVAPNYMHTGDAIKCESCKGILNQFSKVEDIPGSDDKNWKCEFCSHNNTLNIVEEEIPHKNDVTYMLQPAPATKAMKTDGDNSTILFCIDTSGSMVQSKQVSGKFKLKGNRDSAFDGFVEGPRRDQFLPGENRNMTWVSRLQAVQAAVNSQLKNLVENHPERKVGLIIFNNDVTMFGDCPENNVHISGDKLSNFESLLEIGKEFPLPESVRTREKFLSDTLFDLDAAGKTALGPALLASVGLASKSAASKIILCTDGKANVGLGNVEDKEFRETSPEFYAKVCDLAKESGISISVITIEGTDCNLQEIGKLAQETEGSVDRVDPMTLAEEFGNILEDQIIATKVKSTLVIHDGLYLRHETLKESRVEKNIGNVTKETEISFEYGVKPGAFNKIGLKGKPNEVVHLPFQLQIEYTDIEGARALRVITESKPITCEREKAEKEMSWSVLGKHAPKISAKIALKQGREREGQMENITYKRMLSRHKASNVDEYEEFKKLSSPVYMACQQQSSSKNEARDESSKVLYKAAMTRFGKFGKKKKSKDDSD